jgi:hypothetical protein
VAQCRAQLATSIRTLITGSIGQLPWLWAVFNAGGGGAGVGVGGPFLTNAISFVQTAAPVIASLVGDAIAG